METITRQLRGIPDWVLKEYLESLDSQLQPDGWFTASGWQARYTRLPDETYGPMVFQCYLLEFQGEAETLRQVWPNFASAFNEQYYLEMRRVFLWAMM